MDGLEGLLDKVAKAETSEVVVAADVVLQQPEMQESEGVPSPPAEDVQSADTKPRVTIVTEIEEEAGEKPVPIPDPQPVASTLVMNEEIANAVFPIFQSAVETKKVQLVEVVLDTLQLLIAHRLMRGVVTAVGTSLKSGTPPSSHTDPGASSSRVSYQGQAIDMVCSCEDVQDENIELKVLKSLLTAVTSSTFCMHGHGLLLAVRTSYNIYMMSRSLVNQTTAKASLTQMLNVVFQRMESDSQQVAVSPIVVSDYIAPGPTPGAMIDTSAVQNFLNKVVAETFAPSPEDVRQSVAGAFDRQKSLEGMESSSESDQEHIEWRTEAAVQATVQTADQQPIAPIVETTAAKHQEAMPSSGDIRSGVLQRDAYLVFRALCKLSTTSESTVLDQTAIRGKVLALELIKILLENSGPVFRSSEKFISALKDNLCLSMLKNCASSIQEALSLTCSIFLTLLSKFRQSLKAEIAVFFPMVVLKPIEPQLGGPSSVSSTATPAAAPASTSYTHQVWIPAFGSLISMDWCRFVCCVCCSRVVLMDNS